MKSRLAVFCPGRPDRESLRVSFCLLLILLVSVLAISCSAPQVQKNQAKGVYHLVKKGETAYSLARAYSLSLQDLAEINNISDVSMIKEGMVIFIPDADQVIDDVVARAAKTGENARGKAEPAAPRIPPDQPKRGETEGSVDKTPSSRPSSAYESGAPAVVPGTKPSEKPPVLEKPEDVKIDKSLFVWPVKGNVTTRFGIQPDKTYHNWIKIVCRAGSRVKAAASGTVIYSANLKDFGETVIIRHPNEYATVYTHLKRRLIKADQNVRKNDVIALAGEKDRAGNTYINFEIRLKGKARNPLFYLP